MNTKIVFLILGLALLSLASANSPSYEGRHGYGHRYGYGSHKPKPHTSTVVCDAKSRCGDIVCAVVVIDYGCVNYADGSQRYIPINDCTCQDKKVISYEINKQCLIKNPPKKDYNKVKKIANYFGH